jgi:RNA polymerase sigma-70 factor (ECF subfamily)
LAGRTEPEEFAALFDQYYPRLHRYLHRRVGPALAEDLAAQTFAEALRSRGRYPGRADAAPWLYGIAHNLLRGHRRAEQRQLRAYARTGIDPATELDTDAVADRADAASLGPRLAATLARLRAKDREVLLLFAWEGLGYQEIADALGIPVGTVRSRLSRSRKRVRDQLAGAVHTPTTDFIGGSRERA